jgi:hypothetical protein
VRRLFPTLALDELKNRSHRARVSNEMPTGSFCEQSYEASWSMVGKTEVVSNYNKSLARCLGFCPMTLPLFRRRFGYALV